MARSLHDTYDYPGWWEGREFEHKAEAQALSTLLNEIPKRKSIIDIGAGFGRLTPVYAPSFSKITLVESSEKLLRLAKDFLENIRGVEFVRGDVNSLPLGKGLFDVALSVKTLAHLENPEIVAAEASRVLRQDGFLILEFPNKHSLFSTRKNLAAQDSIPFLNHDPKRILNILKSEGFEITKILSVSNLGYRWFKKLLPLPILLRLEERLQSPLARFFFGPSIFILAQKRRETQEHIVRSLDLG